MASNGELNLKHNKLIEVDKKIGIVNSLINGEFGSVSERSLIFVINSVDIGSYL